MYMYIHIYIYIYIYILNAYYELMVGDGNFVFGFILTSHFALK